MFEKFFKGMGEAFASVQLPKPLTPNQWNTFFWTTVKFGSATVLLLMSALLMVKFGREVYENVLWLIMGVVFEVALWALIPDVKRDIVHLKIHDTAEAPGNHWQQALYRSWLKFTKFPWGKFLAMLGLQLYASFAFVSFATNMITTAETEAKALEAQRSFQTDTKSIQEELDNNQKSIDLQNKMLEASSGAVSKGVVTGGQRSADSAKAEVERLTEDRKEIQARFDAKKNAPPPVLDEKARIVASFDKVAEVLKKLIPGFPQALTGMDLLITVLTFAFFMSQILLFLSFAPLPSPEESKKDWFMWEEMESYIYAGLATDKSTKFASDDAISKSTGLSLAKVAKFKALLQETPYEDKMMVVTKQGGTIAQWDRPGILKVMKMNYKSGKFRV